MKVEIDDKFFDTLAKDITSIVKERLSALEIKEQVKEEVKTEPAKEEVKTETVTNSETFTVGFWNVGHWAGGKSHMTAIASDADNAKKKSYKEVLKAVGGGKLPDFFGTAEYSDDFTKDGEKADEVIFNDYKYKSKGKQYGFTHNNVFASLPIIDGGEVKLTAPLGEPYRTYQWAKVKIQGKEVLIVSTHVAHWATTTVKNNEKEQVHQKIRKPQFEQLEAVFADFDYVIMMADWNTVPDCIYCPKYTYGETTKYGYGWGYSEDKINKYEHEEWHNLPLEYAFGRETRHGHTNKSHVDNIIVKGFDIVNAFEANEDLKLSDHVAIGVTLKFK